jgi:hypothetical protein
MKRNELPPGWDEAKIRAVLKHYEEQTDEEAVAEDEAAFFDPSSTVMVIPRELVPAVRMLIFKHEAAKEAAARRKAANRKTRPMTKKRVKL